MFSGVLNENYFHYKPISYFKGTVGSTHNLKLIKLKNNSNNMLCAYKINILFQVFQNKAIGANVQ
jgi:hypothetical protein